LTNSDATEEMKEKTNKIIYQKYEKWAIHKAYIYRQSHYHLAKNIKAKELAIYSTRGLLKAIQHYNPAYAFQKYAEQYIEGELYHGINELQPLNIIPISKRKNKSWREANKTIMKNAHKSVFIGMNDWIIDKNTNTKGINCFDMHELLLDPLYTNNMLKKVFEYKYDISYFERNKKERSNKEIAEMMNCSEENIRLYVNKIKTYFANKKKVVLEDEDFLSFSQK